MFLLFVGINLKDEFKINYLVLLNNTYFGLVNFYIYFYYYYFIYIYIKLTL